jgi:hypothetical protein
MMFLFVDENEDGTFTGTILVGEGGHFGPLAGDALGPFPRVRDLAIEAKSRGRLPQTAPPPVQEG